MLKLGLLQEVNTQALLFEGCGNVKEKLRQKSCLGSLQEQNYKALLPACVPCATLPRVGILEAESQPFHGSLEQCLDELPNVSTTKIKRLKTQLFVLCVTESSFGNKNSFGNKKEKALVTE